jgi:HD-like signal output (HDOD) protein
MSLSPIVLAVLAACWTLPAALVALAYKRERSRAQEPAARDADIVHHLRTVSLNVDIRPEEEQKEWWMVSPTERKSTAAASSVDRSVQHAAVITPYAEVSVTVSDSNGETCVRRCSMCLN